MGDERERLRRKPGLVNSPYWAENEHRTRRAEVTMECSKGKLLDANQILFNDFSASTAILKGVLDEQWLGRYWLPDGDRVEPTHKYCLIRGDGRIGEMLLERFSLGDIKEDFAAFQGGRQFA
jgi:hypothetical protein